MVRPGHPGKARLLSQLTFVKENWRTSEGLGGFLLMFLLGVFAGCLVWVGISEGGLAGYFMALVCTLGCPAMIWVALELLTGRESYRFEGGGCRVERGALTSRKVEELELGKVREVRYLARKEFASDNVLHRVVVRGTGDMVEVGPFPDSASAREWERRASEFFQYSPQENPRAEESPLSEAPPEGSKFRYAYQDGTGVIAMPLAGIRRFEFSLQAINALVWVLTCAFGFKRMFWDGHTAGAELMAWGVGLVLVGGLAARSGLSAWNALREPFLLKVNSGMVEFGPSEGLLRTGQFRWELEAGEAVSANVSVSAGSRRGTLKLTNTSKTRELAAGYTQSELEWLKRAVEHQLQTAAVEEATLRQDVHSRVAIVLEDSGLKWKGFGLTLAEHLDLLDGKLEPHKMEEEDGPLWRLFDLNLPELSEALQRLSALGSGEAGKAEKALTKEEPQQKWHDVSEGVGVFKKLLDLLGSDSELGQELGEDRLYLLGDVEAILAELSGAQERGSRFRLRFLSRRPEDETV